MMRMLTCASCQSTGPLRHVPVTVQFSVSLEDARLQGHASKSRLLTRAGASAPSASSPGAADARRQRRQSQDAGSSSPASDRAADGAAGAAAEDGSRVGGMQGGDSGECGSLRTVETGGGNGGIQPVVTNASLKLLTWLADYAALTRCGEKPKQAKKAVYLLVSTVACCNFLSFPSLQPVVTNAFLKLITWLADHAAPTRCGKTGTVNVSHVSE